jgi:outer membrane protein assembly factor BamB
VAPDYGPSQLLALQILDGPPWLQPLARPQPSARNTGAVVFDPHRRRFYAVNTGARRRGADAWISTTDGTLDAFDLDALRAGDPAPRGTLVLRQGDGGPAGPRDLILTGDQGRLGYLPASNSPHLYKVDLDEWRVLRGGDDPIQAYLGDGDQLTGLAAGEGGLLYLTAFNGDALYLFDTTCDASVAGPFDLGTGPLLEGALMPAWDAPRQQLLVLMTLSSRLARARGPRPPNSGHAQAPTPASSPKRARPPAYMASPPQGDPDHLQGRRPTPQDGPDHLGARPPPPNTTPTT